MTFPILAATLLVIGVAFFAAASRAIFWDRYFKAGVQILLGLCFLTAAAGAGFVAVTLAAYHRLTGEEHVANVNFVRKGDREYTAMFTYPGPDLQVFDLRGDDWQLDARVLKWSGPANLLGFNTLYRLDRISGRYTKIEDEKTAPRTVHAMRPPDLMAARARPQGMGDAVDRRGLRQRHLRADGRRRGLRGARVAHGIARPSPQRRRAQGGGGVEIA